MSIRRSWGRDGAALYVAAFLLAASPLVLTGLGCGKAPLPARDVRLARVGPFSATIEWTTDEPAAPVVEYGEGTLLDRSVVEANPATRHEAVLSGLKPSTVYSYRIGGAGPAARFRSAPASDGAFDLVLIDEGSPLCEGDAPESEAAPDVVVVAGSCTGALARSPQSVLTLSFPEEGATDFPYGGSQVVVASELDTAVRALAGEAGTERRTILVLPRVPEVVPETASDPLVLSPRGAWYRGQRTDWDAGQTAWFEVDVFEVARAQVSAGARERAVLVEAPPETKKSCLYCNRLLESGRYEQSIAWYRAFIEENEGGRSVEDAVFTIAQIEDEKLFRFGEALKGYEEFLRLYPDSRRASLARYRLDYLRAHADGGFGPLEAFERAKAELVLDRPGPAVEAVERLLAEAPGSTVAEEALFWLGHILEQPDPERASRHYRELIARYPEGENAAMAAIALGDIQYRDKRYRSAIAAYENALSIVPDTYRIAVEDKLRKSHRNVYREVARWASWLVLAAWAVAAGVRRPRPSARDGVAALAVLLAYAAAGGAYFALAYDRAGVLIPAMSTMGVAMSALFLWNRAVWRGTQRAGIAFLHAASCSLATVYLILYHFHYLYVFDV